jgi:hypothetical protein
VDKSPAAFSPFFSLKTICFPDREYQKNGGIATEKWNRLLRPVYAIVSLQAQKKQIN